MTHGYDRELLAAKVEWEGGVLATLEWGMRSEDIADEGLAADWRELERLYDAIRPLLRSVQAKLRKMNADE